jgi:Na+-translocating ferredoxin:NAD+ oxidoreductase subunit B
VSVPIELLHPVIVVGCIGLFVGICLAIASKNLQVYINPRIDQVSGVLPGINCGACGYPVCGGFARAVVEGKSKPSGCIPGGSKTAHAIADILGVSAGLSEPLMAVVHCNGGSDKALDRACYLGIGDCHAATLVGNGSKICLDGCLGLGSCVRVCPFSAIRISKEGVAVVDAEKCTGCGKCVKVCPRKVVSLIPLVHKIFLACSNHDRGAKVKKYCSVGCTACTLCVKATPSSAISMDNNLPVLDYTREENFIPAAYKCPSHCFIDLVKTRSKANIDTKCNGCTACIEVCPVSGAINGERDKRHIIDKEKCIGCGICLNVCPVHAIAMWGVGSAVKTNTGKR